MNAPWLHGDPRDVARAVLADPRFHTATAHPHRTWLDPVYDALRALWRSLTSAIGHVTANGTTTTIVGVVVLVAVVAGLVLAIVRFVRLAHRSYVRKRGSALAATQLEDQADAATLHARALAALAAGRLREAAALLWASALRALDERGRVRFDAARSPGEWRRAVRDPAFDALARDAVVALFGDHEIEPALIARMRDAYARVVPA